MEIYIKGRQLHIIKGDVTLNWSNIRFSEAVADEWSTEIELANDTYNIDLLDCYGLLDRGAIYNHKVICSVLVDDIAKDGYLQILSIDETTIKARAYIISIPYAVLDKKVCEYYPHDDVVFRWDRFSPITTNIAGVNEGIIPYDYTNTDFYSNILAQWHASVSVQKVLDNIQVAEDLTLPAVDNTLFQLAANKKVCPSNNYQVMQGNLLHSNAISDKNLEVSGGQHITNDLKSSWSYADFHWNYNWSDWLVESTNEKWMTQAETMSEITFNRPVNAHIKVYACASEIGGILIPKKNGESLIPAPAASIPVLTNPNWTVNDILIFDDMVGFDNGDILTFHYSGSAQTPRRNVRYSVVIEYTDYEWTDEDYDTDLVYIPAPFGIWGIRDLGSDYAYDFKYDFSGTGDGTNSPEDYSYTYFGAYTNLERDLTVRDYLTSLCWIHNQKLKLDKNELIFQSANQQKVINANLTQIDPATDKLGQTNTIGYSKLEDSTVFSIDNEFLETEKTIHENSFYSADVIPQYSYEMTYSENANSEGEHWITDINVNFEEFDAVIMSAVDENGRYTLKKAPEIAGFGLPAMTNAQTITGKTLEDISSLDYLSIDGHKYMVVEGNMDLNTYISEFTAIQCDSVFNFIPVIVINSIVTTGTTADVTFTVTGIFIEGSTLTIYSDSELTQIVQVIDGTNEGIQTITVTGLTPDTTYYAVVTATDAQGNEGTSQTKMFRTVVYQFRGSVRLTDDYDTLAANVNVICLGATFTQTGIEFSTNSDFSGEIITGSRSSDTFDGNVTGFEANTLYYYRFFATSDYGTQYHTPLFNTITTMYAPPTLTITEVSSTPDTLTLSFLYSGDYPYDHYYSCVIGLADDSEQPVEINLDDLRPNTPLIVTVDNLIVGSEYVVSWDVEYYHNEVSVIEYFTTQAHNFDFTTNLDSYSDTTARITTHAEQITVIRLNVTNIGINLNTTPDFESGRDMGGNLGYGDLDYRLNKTGLSERTVYYYRPWIETSEFGREYGATASFETLYSMPTVTITEEAVTYDAITVSVNYAGNYPVPSNGVLYLEKEGVILQRLDASRLRPNDDTIFTFTNLDELTTYTITYNGDYYVQRDAITDTITATTGERINITCVHAWNPNGQCTHTITVQSYEAIDTFNGTFNNPDITMVEDWTLNGNTIEGVSFGYDYNENPYTLNFVVTIGGGYTVTRSFEFSVPQDDLRVIYELLGYFPPRTERNIEGTIYKRIGSGENRRWQFNIDVPNTYLVLVERTTGYEFPRIQCTGVDTTLDDLTNRLKTSTQYIPVGNYRAKWTVTNIMHQTVTSYDMYNTNIVIDGACFYNTSSTKSSIKFSVNFNMFSGYTPTKKVDLLYEGQVVDSVQWNSGYAFTNVQFTNLDSNKTYTLAAYYDLNELPVTQEYSTQPNDYAISSISDITATSATINISIS